MTQFSTTLEAIEGKVKELINRKKGLEDQLEKAKDRLKKLEEDLALKSKEIESLEEKNKILRIAGGNDEGNNKEIKLKINEILREVDKCIAQLNQ